MSYEQSLQFFSSALRILLVEDSTDDAELVEMMLKRGNQNDLSLRHVFTLAEADHALRQSDFDIILLDLGLPDNLGPEAVRRLKALAPSTPIVVLTGDERDDTARAAIEMGAQDYLPKQEAVVEVLNRIVQHSILRQHRLAQAESLALCDALTGLANRRAFDLELARRFAEYDRHGHAFSIALFDIDHFKQINDRWGHSFGDQVIQSVAQVLTRCSRTTDVIVRYGGEEFAIILPMTDEQTALRAILRCHTAVTAETIGTQRHQVTTSVGLASVSLDDDQESIVERADAALYDAKNAGRKCCRVHRGDASIDGHLAMAKQRELLRP